MRRLLGARGLAGGGARNGMPRLADRGMQVKRKRPSRQDMTVETGCEAAAEAAADPVAG